MYIDDILVTGRTDQEHLGRLGQVLRVLEEHGLRLRWDKCRFMSQMVEYLGYRVDQHGLRPLASKVTAITDAPQPRNVQELRAFLGLVNYYGRFLSNLATVAAPLHKLLCKDVRWVWISECNRAFTQLKSKLASSEVLAHYDLQVPLRLECDASSYGVGAVLSHKYIPNGTEHPITYASRTLSAAEKNYAQIEKEGLALVFKVQKFHKYIYGHKFTMVTDHKPLLAIFGSKKSLATLAAARLQRWAIFLMGYNYDLEFWPTGKHSNADGFSRLPRACAPGEEVELDLGATACNLVKLEALPLSCKDLQAATAADSTLSTVRRYVRDGWPLEVTPGLQPYYKRKDGLSLDRGCLFWGTRVVIPAACRPQVMSELHMGHQGIVKMKGLARSHVWWPGLDQQVEDLVRSCGACQETRNKPPPAPLHPWPWAKLPWERIHLDFAGPFMGKMFLVVVDSHSH